MVMATIQVYKHGSDTLLGSGSGTVDTRQHTAAITEWTKKAGITQNTTYKLKSEGKTYSDSRCTAVGLPAKFSDVE
jgi:hypothetical protein